MNPIFLILYVVLLTLMLTLFYPKLRSSNPKALWGGAIPGVLGLVVLIYFALLR